MSITTIRQSKFGKIRKITYFSLILLGKLKIFERIRQMNTTKIFVFFFNIKLTTKINNKNNN